MTTAVWDGKTLSADKRSSYHDTKHATCTKVFKVRGHLIAVAGSYDIAIEMIEWFSDGCDPDFFPEKQKTEPATMMVITPDREIHKYERSHLPLKFENEKEAIGSGREFALAAMACGCDSAEAVRVASMFDCYTGNGVDTVSFDE